MTSDSSLSENQTTETFVYNSEWSYDIEMSIVNINHLGQVVVQLSKEIVPPEDLSEIDETILDLIVLTENVNNKDKLDFKWSVVDFNST